MTQMKNDKKAKSAAIADIKEALKGSKCFICFIKELDETMEHLVLDQIQQQELLNGKD